MTGGGADGETEVRSEDRRGAGGSGRERGYRGRKGSRGDAANGAPGRLSMSRLLAATLCFALLTGLLELGVVGVHKYVLGRLTRVSPHVVWMAPAAELPFFLGAATLLAGLGLRWPRARDPGLAYPVLAALSALALLLLVPGIHVLAVVVLAAGVGLQAGRWLARRSDRFLRRAPALLAGGALAVALLAAAVPGRSALREARARVSLPEPPPEAPNVLLLILDTVRAGSLGLYGRERETSPRLEAWAERGVVFDRAYAASPWTLPSHASFFTGRLPHETGTGFYRPLDGTWPTLAEVLARRGYETAGFTANLVYTTYVQGLDRGFIHYEDYPVSPGQVLLSGALGRELLTSTRLRDLTDWHELANRKSAERVNRDFLAWLDGRSEEEAARPWFAFLNYFDAHEPYLPPPPFDRRFGPAVEREPLRHWGGLRAGNEARRPDDYRRTPRDVAADLEAYEEATAYADDRLGALLEALESRGVLERTLVVIASDHGEQHGEHGLFYHWNSLYLPLLHVPLVLLAGEEVPGEVPAGLRVDRPVSLRDLPATVSELAGPSAEHPFPGASLARTWTPPAATGSPSPDSGASPDSPSGAEAAADAIVSELERGPMFSLIRGPWHYILDMSSGRPRESLHHVLRDPGEIRDRAGEPAHMETLGRLRREMIEVLEAAEAGLPAASGPGAEGPGRSAPRP